MLFDQQPTIEFDHCATGLAQLCCSDSVKSGWFPCGDICVTRALVAENRQTRIRVLVNCGRNRAGDWVQGTAGMAGNGRIPARIESRQFYISINYEG